MPVLLRKIGSALRRGDIGALFRFNTVRDEAFAEWYQTVGTPALPAVPPTHPIPHDPPHAMIRPGTTPNRSLPRPHNPSKNEHAPPPLTPL